MNIQIEFSIPLLFMTIPVILTWIVYYTTHKITKNKWKAIHISVQATAIFYIIAVTFLLQKLFKYQLFGMMLIILFVMLSVILIIQWKLHTEVLLSRGLKVLARFSFLVFGCLYIGLVSYEIIYYIYTQYSG